MGYRHYIVRVEKEKLEEIRDLSHEQLKQIYSDKVDSWGEGNEYLSIHDILEKLFCQKVVDLGKYFDNDVWSKMVSENVFNEKSVEDNYEDYQLRILNEDSFLIMATHFEDNVKLHNDLLLTPQAADEDFPEYLFDPIKPNPVTDEKLILNDPYIVNRIVKDFLSRRRLWAVDAVLSKSKEREFLTHSWYYEHEVFDVLRIHKTADFNKYYYLIYGY